MLTEECRKDISEVGGYSSWFLMSVGEDLWNRRVRWFLERLEMFCNVNIISVFAATTHQVNNVLCDY